MKVFRKIEKILKVYTLDAIDIQKRVRFTFVVEFCILTSRISDYPLISQGKTRISGVNDGDDFELTDVSV